jgi:hypothetical protein
MIVNHEYHGVLIDTFSEGVNNWLHDKFGLIGDRWFTKRSFSGTMIYFKNSSDHLLFFLAWGKSE